MKIRPRSLPAGWYPSTKSQTVAQIEEFLHQIKKQTDKAGAPSPSETAIAGIVPHAGWSFSGKIALEVLQMLSGENETIVIIGGHLLPRAGVLAAFEEGYDTPLGLIKADVDLFEYLRKKTKLQSDYFADNTVEIQLPFVKYLFPEANVLALRSSPSEESIRLGEMLEGAARHLGRRIAVIGSTDLTHYGPNYGFTPKGSGRKAVQWVKEVNDRRLIDSLLSMDLSGALKRGVEEKSACSVGGAVAAARFAQQSGITKGKLIHYTTSYDIYPNESFVGYAGIIY